MRVVRARTPGGPETLTVEEMPDAVPAPGEVLIDVVGAGLNRADSLQRQGRYHLPPDATDILGMEVSGTVAALGVGVTEFAPGDRVMALLSSGGYATRVAVPVGQVMPAPRRLGLLEAAAIPEVAATLVANICMAGRFAAGETVLIHGATGGIGTFGIQLVKALGGRVAVTASSPAKLETARALGADILIDYSSEDFAERLTDEGGVDIVLDTVAGPYLAQNLRVLKPFGRIVTIGAQGGRTAELDFGVLMSKKASIIGTLLRDRTVAQKSEVVARTRETVLPLIESGAVDTTIDSVFPLDEVAEAHRRLDSGEHVGKVLLDCRTTDE